MQSVVALATETPGEIARRLDTDVLAGADRGGAWLIVPDPDWPRRTAAITRTLGESK